MPLSDFLQSLADQHGADQLAGAAVLARLERPIDDLISSAMALGPYHPGKPSPWSHTFLLAEPFHGPTTKILDCTIRTPDGAIDWNDDLLAVLSKGIDENGGIYDGTVADYDDRRITKYGVKLITDLTSAQRTTIVAAGKQLQADGYHYDIPGLVRELVRLLSLAITCETRLYSRRIRKETLMRPLTGLLLLAACLLTSIAIARDENPPPVNTIAIPQPTTTTSPAPQQQPPLRVLPDVERLHYGVPLVLFDLQMGATLTYYAGSPNKTLIDQLNSPTPPCQYETNQLTTLEGSREFDDASKGAQLAILYTATDPAPTYSFTLTNLTPRIQDQITSIPLVSRNIAEQCTAKIIIKYYAATSAWVNFTGNVTPAGKNKLSVDLVIGPKYHLLLPGSLAVTSVRSLKYNSTTKQLEPKDTPKSGYVGIGYSLSDVYQFGVAAQAFVSLASKPLDSFGAAVGIHTPHFHVGSVQLDQLALYYGPVWTRTDQTAANGHGRSHFVGKGRLLLSYDVASLAKLLKSTKTTSSSNVSTAKTGS